MKAWTLAASFSSSKLILPTPAWTLPPLSARYSTLPALNSLTAAVTSAPAGMTVPALGVGIRPRGPSTLPSRLTWPIMFCVARATSNSSQLSVWIFLMMSSEPAEGAAAAPAGAREAAGAGGGAGVSVGGGGAAGAAAAPSVGGAAFLAMILSLGRELGENGGPARASAFDGEAHAAGGAGHDPGGVL